MSRSHRRSLAPPSITVVAGLLLCFATQSTAAVLDCGDTSAWAGDSGVSIQVILTAEPGEDVAGIQFDLAYDPDVFSVDGVEPGEAAVDAVKDASFSILEPGRARIIIAGFNQNVIGNGSVACIYFSIGQEAPDAVYSVTPVAVLMSDPWGGNISAEGTAGTITVGVPPEDVNDINGDGDCDASDVQVVVNCALGVDVEYDCDVNGDGAVDAMDIQKVINAVLDVE